MLGFTYKKTTSLFSILLLSVIISFPVLANHHETGHNDSTDIHSESITTETSEIYNPVPAIMHHISDSHEWHFWGEGENSATIPLPIILYTDGHLDIFMSSSFHHGHSDVKCDTRTYNIDHHGHITEKSGLSFIDLSITKNVASMLIALLLLLIVFGVTGAKARKNNGAPKGLLSFLEPLVLFVRDDIVKPNIGKNYQKYLPYLLTLFFFILMNNLLGLLPGSANVTGNIAITLVLSFITLIVTNINGKKSYWGHIFKPPGVPLALMPIMIPIEIVGIFTKPFALMIRLFANISAGHIIILSLISLIFMAQSGLGDIAAWSLSPVAVAFVLFMDLIEVLVAFLQAYIFTLLTSLFIGLATVEHH
jgi:F-type H+-transporting ATPase subunit a